MEGIIELLSQEPLSVSERISICDIAGWTLCRDCHLHEELSFLKQQYFVTDKLTKMVKLLVVSLLTEWIPTPKLLKIALELARTSFQLLDVLGADCVEWPECLSEWLQ